MTHYFGTEERQKRVQQGRISHLMFGQEAEKVRKWDQNQEVLANAEGERTPSS